MPNLLAGLARHLPLGRSWLAFADVLAVESEVDVRLRERVILWVAWRTRSTYEWKQHVRIGADAGLTTEQLHASPAGADDAVWSPVERALLRATDESIDDHLVSDATWSELVGEL